jgi:hypothetical protein
MNRVFLLSPANCSGARARLVFREESTLELSRRLRSPQGASLGEVFTFMSGLYFRGKLAYANAFARTPDGGEGVLVVTPDRGLLPARAPVSVETLRSFARVPIDPSVPEYRKPLERDTIRLAGSITDDCEVVLLGSVATDKYVGILHAALGPRLRFPAEFVGRGDMSRGGLMLRCVEEGRELVYVPVDGRPRHGSPPPRLAPRRARALD